MDLTKKWPKVGKWSFLFRVCRFCGEKICEKVSKWPKKVTKWPFLKTKVATKMG